MPKYRVCKSRIRTNLSKLRAWCRGGGEAPAYLRLLGPDIWTADKPPNQNSLAVLGAPLSLPEFVATHAQSRIEEEEKLLKMFTQIPDLQ